MHGFDKLFEFENALAEFTGAPYVVLTDGCTHAIELCLRYEKPHWLSFTAFTYLSVPMLIHQLGIEYQLIEEDWHGEYQLHGSRIWDSARRLERGMYRPGQIQCLSFGVGKPIHIGKIGAILLDDPTAYKRLSMLRSDGRDLRIKPWQDQKNFFVGYHYCPTLEDCAYGIKKLENFPGACQKVSYPDCRKISIIS